MWKPANLLYSQVAYLVLRGFGIWPELLTLKDVPNEKS